MYPIIRIVYYDHKRPILKYIIKVFSLYLIISTISYYLPLISSIAYDGNDLTLAAALIIPFIVIIGAILLLLFKTEKIVERLKLDSGHSNKKLTTKPFNELTIVKLSIVIISLYLFVNGLPSFIYQSFTFFKNTTIGPSGLLESFDVVRYFDLYD